MALQGVTNAVKDAAPKVAEENKGAGYLMSGMSLIAGTLAFVGVKGDDLENIWRTYAVISFLGVGAILIAVALGATAGWIIPKGNKWERRCLLAGNGLLAAGLIAITLCGMALASNSPDPTITVKPIEEKGRTLLKVEVSDSKLRYDEGLQVSVEPLYEIQEVQAEETKIRYRVGRPFYSASLAPSEDGDVSHTREVEIPPGKFQNVGVRVSAPAGVKCYDKPNESGCLRVRIPQRSEEPRLSFRWRGKEGRGIRLLRVRVQALDVPERALRFRVMVLKPDKRALAQATLPSNRHGDVDYFFALPIQRARVVCVAASTATSPLTCPPKDGSGPSWARLRVPGSR